MDKKPATVYEGLLSAENVRLAVVCARFNEFFVSKLLGGAMDTFFRHGGKEENLSVAYVPGSFEIPLAVSKLMQSGKYDAVIALGVVIQGSTAHASYINGQVSKSLGELALKHGIPAIYGVVTTENIEQAIERSGTKAGNRGADAAHSAIEMANLMKALPEGC